MIHHENHSNHSNHVSHLDYIQLQYIKLHPILNSRDHLKIVCRASIIVHIAGTAKHSVMLVGIVEAVPPSEIQLMFKPDYIKYCPKRDMAWPFEDMPPKTLMAADQLITQLLDIISYNFHAQSLQSLQSWKSFQSL